MAETQTENKVAVIDADGCVAGRLATHVAGRLLEGEEIHLVNAEKAIVTGARSSIMERFEFKRTVGTRRKGPFYPRMPHLMLKRTVRGMLNYQKSSAHRAAYKRLKCHIGTPDEFEGQTPEVVDGAKPKNAYRSMTLGEVARNLGAKF